MQGEGTQVTERKQLLGVPRWRPGGYRAMRQRQVSVRSTSNIPNRDRRIAFPRRAPRPGPTDRRENNRLSSTSSRRNASGRRRWAAGVRRRWAVGVRRRRMGSPTGGFRVRHRPRRRQGGVAGLLIYLERRALRQGLSAENFEGIARRLRVQTTEAADYHPQPPDRREKPGRSLRPHEPEQALARLSVRASLRFWSKVLPTCPAAAGGTLRPICSPGFPEWLHGAKPFPIHLMPV